MNLLVDVGNTRIKWRCLNSKNIELGEGVVLSKSLVKGCLDELFQEYFLEEIYLSNVGQDAVLDVFKEYSESNSINLNVVYPQKVMCGLTFAYKDVDRLGVDRCLAMIGAFNKAGVMVLDAGSAITVDYVNHKGVHLGGYILPGYEMSRSVLFDETAKVNVMGSLGSLEPGTNTESCVSNGFAVLYKSFLEGCMVVAKNLEINKFIFTGGDAKVFAALSSEFVGCCEGLVLDGLEKYSLQSSRVVEV